MKIVVIDDDPTGSQTVYGCPLLLSWELNVLREGLRKNTPLMFVLANSRALLAEEASKRIKDICFALKEAIRAENLSQSEVLLISRGDSTLRGHWVLEPKVIAQEFGPFDATLHVPAFFEGGRTTINGVHFLDGVPVHMTEFASDQLFGYSTSDLAKWLQEKSQGSIVSSTVKKITLTQLDSAVNSSKGKQDLKRLLDSFTDNQNVVVDALRSEQLCALAEVVRSLIGKKQFLFRSAASFINSLSELAPRILPENEISSLRRHDSFGNSLPGMVLVGSHVNLTDLQLETLLECNQCIGIELPVAKLATIFKTEKKELLLKDLELYLTTRIQELLAEGKTPVFYTTRGEICFSEVKQRLDFGYFLARMMARVAGSIAPKLGYLISKGGVTTNVLLKEGLDLKLVNLSGQILPGLSIVMTSSKGSVSDLPIVTFPGNLGNRETLIHAWRIIESC